MVILVLFSLLMTKEAFSAFLTNYFPLLEENSTFLWESMNKKQAFSKSVDGRNAVRRYRWTLKNNVRYGTVPINYPTDGPKPTAFIDTRFSKKKVFIEALMEGIKFWELAIVNMKSETVEFFGCFRGLSWFSYLEKDLK